MNSSAKICLIMDETFRSTLDKLKFTPWNQLEDIYMQTTLESFIFYHTSFAFRMMKLTVDKLIDTGIMRYLVDDDLRIKNPPKLNDDPKVLSLNDLDFGFTIYLGFCGLSFFIILLEITWYNVNSKSNYSIIILLEFQRNSLIFFLNS